MVKDGAPSCSLLWYMHWHSCIIRLIIMLSTALMKAPLIAAALGTKSLSGRALCKEEADVDGGSTTEAGREEKSASRSSSVAMGIMGSGPCAIIAQGRQSACFSCASQPRSSCLALLDGSSLWASLGTIKRLSVHFTRFGSPTTSSPSDTARAPRTTPHLLCA